MASLFQEFHYVDPEVLMKVINIFNTSFYGSNLWDIFSTGCERIFKSWNVSIRQAFEVDRCTHRYLIESISKSLHPKVMLASRYMSFHQFLISSTKLSVRIMARLFERDGRTVLGRTLHQISSECNLSDITFLTSQTVKKNSRYYRVPPEEQWRVPFVNEVLQIRKEKLLLPGFTSDEVKTILDFLCKE